MAQIKFTGFVQEWNKSNPQHPAWGMKTAETHSRKNENGELYTASRTFRTVKAANGSDTDFTQFKEGDLVEVTGWEVTEVREYNGEKMYNLVVRADNVVLAEKKAKKEPSAPLGFDDEMPF